MEYKRIDNSIYLRVEKNEEICTQILTVCQKENIFAASAQGIAACSKVTLATYIPEKNDFIYHSKCAMLEMTSLMGNISQDHNQQPFYHLHANFSYLENDEIKVIGGHLEEAIVGYTAEIIINAVPMALSRQFDSKAKIDVWKLIDSE